MLEFYQAYADYEDLMVLTESLFGDLAQATVGGLTLTYRGEAIDLRPPWRRLPYLEGVVGALGLARAEASDGKVIRAAAERMAAARGVGPGGLGVEPAGPRIRLADDGGRGHRHRSADHALHRPAVDPRGHPLPAAPPRGE